MRATLFGAVLWLGSCGAEPTVPVEAACIPRTDTVWVAGADSVRRIGAIITSICFRK